MAMPSMKNCDHVPVNQFRRLNKASTCLETLGACAMTTIFLDNKFALSTFYCHGVSHREKQRFGTIFLSAPKAHPSQKHKFCLYCRLAVSETFRGIFRILRFAYRFGSCKSLRGAKPGGFQTGGFPGKIPGPSPSKSGKSQKNRESPKKDKKGRTSPDRETPPFQTSRLAALEIRIGLGGNFVLQTCRRQKTPC